MPRVIDLILAWLLWHTIAEFDIVKDQRTVGSAWGTFKPHYCTWIEAEACGTIGFLAVNRPTHWGSKQEVVLACSHSFFPIVDRGDCKGKTKMRVTPPKNYFYLTSQNHVSVTCWDSWVVDWLSFLWLFILLFCMYFFNKGWARHSRDLEWSTI